MKYSPLTPSICGEAPKPLLGPARERGIFDALAAAGRSPRRAGARLRRRPERGPRSEAEGVPGQGGPAGEEAR